MHGTRNEVIPLSPPFEIVLRGFDRQQVIDHVNALKARVATIGAERDAALQRATDLNEKFEQLRREVAEATTQVDRLRHEAAEAAAEVDRLQRSPLTAATARIQRMLQMAEDEAAELRTTTEQETTSLRESARAEADRLLAETTQRCERLEAELQRRRQTTDSETAARRQQAEQQAEQDIARRRAETEAWVRDYQTRSVAALHLIMQMAGERLSSRVARVKRQVTAARALRSEVTGQLSEVYRLLVQALGVVDQPTPTEQAEEAEQAEHAEQAEPSDGSPPPLAGDAGPFDTPRAPRQWERPGPAGWHPQADQPTARFGLHP
jgi:cell division septum initiation protein DivIVA